MDERFCGFFFPMSSKCIQTSNLPLPGQALFVTKLFFYAELTCCSLGEIRVTAIVALFVSLFWVHRASFPRDPDWLLKVKAPSSASFLSIWHPRPPDTWHYDTAAGSLELQRFCQNLGSKLLCNSLISVHINTLSSCTLSLSCCYPSLSCNIQQYSKFLGWLDAFGLSLFFLSLKAIYLSFLIYFRILFTFTFSHNYVP